MFFVGSISWQYFDYPNFSFYKKIRFRTNIRDIEEITLTSVSQMPSVMCPIGACIFSMPFGVGALIYYMRAGTSSGNRF